MYGSIFVTIFWYLRVQFAYSLKVVWVASDDLLLPLANNKYSKRLPSQLTS